MHSTFVEITRRQGACVVLLLRSPVGAQGTCVDITGRLTAFLVPSMLLLTSPAGGLHSKQVGRIVVLLLISPAVAQGTGVDITGRLAAFLAPSIIPLTSTAGGTHE